MTPIARDRWGRPLIQPPDGGKPIPYTRVTTVAKTLEDEGGLAKWKMRMTALGLVARPDLHALVATANGDKGTLDRLCDEALEAAGGSVRANLGTALHAATEHLDRGGDPGEMIDALRPDLDAYSAATAGLGIDPAHVERFVVLDDEWQVAGTFDRLVTLPDGRLVVADIKTGTDLRYSWRSIAVQLALYSRGTYYDDGARTHMPEVDPGVGLVIHLPAGEGRCDLWEVDLVQGWEAAERSMWTRRWRKADVARKLSAVERSAAAPAGQGEAAPGPAASPSIATLRDGHRRGMLIARCRWLAEHAPGFRDALALRWPTGVPSLASDHAHTADELDLIDQAVTMAATAVEAPFEPGVDTENPVRHTATPAPAPELPDEGPPVDTADVEGLAAMVAGLADRAPLDAWTAAVRRDGGRSLNLNDRRTLWRWSVARALVLAARSGLNDEDVRTMLYGAVGRQDVLQPAIALGACLAALTTAEAVRLAALIQALDGDGITLAFSADGTPSFSGQAYDALPAA